ncbi:MAG: hypothetical protein M0Z75_14110, partial [Nitrospiraceae bacterium]|nr:hypothetical protein [Nitrospiraceae bacterium]
MSVNRPDDKTLRICLAGDWMLGSDIPQAGVITGEIGAGPRIERVTFCTDSLGGWDTGLLTFLVKVLNYCSGDGIVADRNGLPGGVQRLLTLASAPPGMKGARREPARISVLEWFGGAALGFWRGLLEMTEFIGEAAVAFVRFITGRARFRRSDLFVTIQQCGAQALPIVSLISVLVGLILAFIGAIQLKV